MRWTVHVERTLYQDRWVHLGSADVELPDGRRLDHRLVRSADCASLLVTHAAATLLLWRHRFITDAWGWEVPGGAIEPGEEPATAAARELAEETGWRPVPPVRPLIQLEPMPGLASARHHVFHTETAVPVGRPSDWFESDRIAWVPLSDIPELIRGGQVGDATTLVALLRVLALPMGPGCRRPAGDSVL